VQANLSLSVTNDGETAGRNVAVRVAIDGGEFQDGGMISILPAGETAALTIAHALAPGERRITFTVSDPESVRPESVREKHSEVVSVHAADIAIMLTEYTIKGDGAMTFEARVTNVGTIPAEDVALSAVWTARPRGDDTLGEGVSGSAQRAVVIERIEPGASETATLLLPIPTGAYDVTLSASTVSLEAVTDDNATAAPVAVDYVDLALTIGAVRVTGYDSDGNGIVEIPLSIANEGAAPSGPLTVGGLCPTMTKAEPDCSPSSVMLESIPASGRASTILTLVLPQGETTVTAYAGALDDGYRWGERNTAQSAIRVPDKLPVELALDAVADVLDYWSDDTAEVELTLSLSNHGYRSASESYDIAVICYGDDDEPLMDECGGAVEDVELPDGFGPAEQVVRVRAPMGAHLRAAIVEPATESAPVPVPERILGIDRGIWECFSDRSDEEATPDDHFLGGCGGWTSSTIRKWDQDGPVTVWADPSGDQLYVDALEETLNDLAPLLNLDFEWVDTPEQAQIKAYVGVPADRRTDIGFTNHCQDADGCGGPDLDVGGAITAASLSVWLDDRAQSPDEHRAEIRRATLRQALHALAAIHHRPAFISLIAAPDALRLSEMSEQDKALLRLHAHPLVRPGMTMAEVEELIVFSDDLRGSPPPAVVENKTWFAERTHAALLQAGSAQFRVNGQWGGGRGCSASTFNGSYAIGELGSGFPALIRFDGDSGNFIFRYSESTGLRYWQQSRGGWRSTSLESISRLTNWEHGFTDPADMLVSVISYADPDTIEITQPSDGKAELKVTLSNLQLLQIPWANSVTLYIDITLSTLTYEVSEYEMGWRFDVGSQNTCSAYDVRATEGEYGINIPIPNIIAN